MKVMQVLYAMSQDPELDFQKALSHYQRKVSTSFELYLFALRYFIRIAKYAEKDAEKKHSKLRPSEEDRKFKPHLYANELMNSLAGNEALQKVFRDYQVEKNIEEDIVRLAYNHFARQEDYQIYAIQDEPSPEEHVAMLLALFRDISKNETFVETLEDHYPNWLDDQSLVIGAIKKNIKALPVAPDFFEEYRPSKEATKEFGEELMRKVHEEDQELLGIIEPILKNWDAERVAVVDMILLKMAICELTAFPTIPTKVTLNEFVEISKLYSTDKSKDFINGILDRLMKKLTEEGKIKKSGRGLID